jgi:hypothetical protein
MDDNKNIEDKNDKKESIDYSLYENEPEKLFSLAKDNIKNNKFEEGIEILGKSIELAIKKFGGEDKIELAQFYNNYSDSIIQKLMITNDDPLNFQEEKSLIENISQDKKDDENKIDVLLEEKKTEEPQNANTEEKNPEGHEGIIGDEDIVFANLKAANLLLKNYLKDYDDKDPKTLDKDTIKYYKQLCDNYSLFANLEKINSDFKQAYHYYKLSIDTCKKYDDKYSRNLAGLYFEQAQILDFDPYNCLLSLYKSKIIMEYHLQKELDKANIQIKFDIDEKELDLDTLAYDSKVIFKNKELIKSEEIKKAFKDNCNIEEFVDIIKDIDTKLEDVILELKEYKNYLKAKEQMKKDGEKQDCFNKNIDMSKVMDLSKITMIKKKRNEPINNNDDIKKPEDIDTKEKIHS